MEYEGCYFMTFKMEQGNGYELVTYLNELLRADGLKKETLVSPAECPVFEKYDDFIPSELLRKSYMADRLRTDEVIRRLREMLEEY